MSVTSAPSRKRARCRSTIQAPGSPAVVTPNPTVPSSASTSTTRVPSTLMPEAAAALVVARIARHRGGDVVVDPVVALLVVVVGSPARADREGPDVGDPWRAHGAPLRARPAGRPGSCSPCCGPRARSSKLCGAPSQPTRPSISDAIPSGTVPTQSAVSANSAGAVGERADQAPLLGADRVRRQVQLRRAHADQHDPGARGPKRPARRRPSGSRPPRRPPRWRDHPTPRRPRRPGHPRSDRSPARRARRTAPGATGSHRRRPGCRPPAAGRRAGTPARSARRR